MTHRSNVAHSVERGDPSLATLDLSEEYLSNSVLTIRALDLGLDLALSRDLTRLIFFKIIYNKGWNPKLNESAIFAQCDGTVRYTTEIFVPAPGTVEARTIEKMPKGAFIYKLHCHVVPPPQATVFEMESFL